MGVTAKAGPEIQLIMTKGAGVDKAVTAQLK